MADLNWFVQSIDMTIPRKPPWAGPWRLVQGQWLRDYWHVEDRYESNPSSGNAMTRKGFNALHQVVFTKTRCTLHGPKVAI